MRSFTVFFFILGLVLWGAETKLKILKVIPFGEGNLKLVFNQNISPNDLTQQNLAPNQSILNIRAILATKQKRYLFPNKMQFQVIQIRKNLVRITMLAPRKEQYELRFSKQNLYIEFNFKKKSIQKQQKWIKHTQQKRIVLDAGHGGKDCGALGVMKVCEKVITLNIAKLLEIELKKRGYIVYMTRSKDYYLGLRERTQYANNKGADLFISIHANSVPKHSSKTANGVETYFLSTARSERARHIAEKENKDSIEVMNLFSKQTFLNSINSHRLIASNKLAIDVQSGILKSLRKDYSNVLDGGVREGPFWVLAGALMPSILVEVGYTSHPHEGRRINHKDYQKSIAQGIADGIDGYFEKNP